MLPMSFLRCCSRQRFIVAHSRSWPRSQRLRDSPRFGLPKLPSAPPESSAAIALGGSTTGRGRPTSGASPKVTVSLQPSAFSVQFGTRRLTAAGQECTMWSTSHPAPGTPIPCVGETDCLAERLLLTRYRGRSERHSLHLHCGPGAQGKHGLPSLLATPQPVQPSTESPSSPRPAITARSQGKPSRASRPLTTTHIQPWRCFAYGLRASGQVPRIAAGAFTGTPESADA